MLSRLEYVHAKSFLHRDVKPDNFLMGANRKAHQVQLLCYFNVLLYYCTAETTSEAGSLPHGRQPQGTRGAATLLLYFTAETTSTETVATETTGAGTLLLRLEVLILLLCIQTIVMPTETTATTTDTDTTTNTTATATTNTTNTTNATDATTTMLL